ANWLLKVQADGARPEVFAEMLAWCDADPMNKAAMERIEEAWALAGDVDPAMVEALPLALESFPHRREANYSHWRLAASFIGIALLIGITAAGIDAWRAQPGDSAGDHIVTARGAHERTTLPDGSQVELGGKSAMSVVYSPQSRIVVAEDG